MFHEVSCHGTCIHLQFSHYRQMLSGKIFSANNRLALWSSMDEYFWTWNCSYYFLKYIKNALKALCHAWNMHNGTKLICDIESNNELKLFSPWFSNASSSSSHILMIWHQFLNRKLCYDTITAACRVTHWSRWNMHNTCCGLHRLMLQICQYLLTCIINTLNKLFF